MGAQGLQNRQLPATQGRILEDPGKSQVAPDPDTGSLPLACLFLISDKHTLGRATVIWPTAGAQGPPVRRPRPQVCLEASFHPTQLREVARLKLPRWAAHAVTLNWAMRRPVSWCHSLRQPPERSTVGTPASHSPLPHPGSTEHDHQLAEVTAFHFQARAVDKCPPWPLVVDSVRSQLPHPEGTRAPRLRRPREELGLQPAATQ